MGYGMDGSNPPFLEETARFWQAKYDSPLTAEDARTCIENVSGFFAVLQGWSLRATCSEPQNGDHDANHEKTK